MFENQKVLITGGTGSFGNAVLKKLLKTNTSEIRIFSRDETRGHEERTEILITILSRRCERSNSPQHSNGRHRLCISCCSVKTSAIV